MDVPRAVRLKGEEYMGVTDRLRRLMSPADAPARTLGGFVDSLLQTFENCRAGLSDAQAAEGGEDVERFFVQLYEREAEHLRDATELHEVQLPPEARRHLLDEVDARVRSVVIPAYARLAAPLTVRERNDFYLTPAPLHGAERLGWAMGGVLLGAFIVWAPFIPIWSKELVLVLGVGGLVFPELRRIVALRRYQSDLDRLVTRTDADIARLEMALLTGEVLRGPARGRSAAADEAGSTLEERLSQDEPAAAEPVGKRRNTIRQGGL
jgi:hypothetical protein